MLFLSQKTSNKFGKMHVNKLIFYFTLFISSLILCQNQTVGVFEYNQGLYDAYTLFSPSRDTYLIDNCGRVVHTWSSDYQSGGGIYFLEDGLLLRRCILNVFLASSIHKITES